MAPGNNVPAFLSIDGPIREVRFIRNPNGTPDGGVHDVFTIAGRGAPLWGLGQRAFFLHDGRTSDLIEAIVAHGGQGSEGDRVVEGFRSKPRSQQQDLLNFLRSL